MNHLITAPTKTALAEALGEAGIDKMPLKPGEPVRIDGAFDFMNTLGSVVDGRRFVMWAVTNALNNSIIAQLQVHFRRQDITQEAEMNADLEHLRTQMDEQTFEKWCEMRNQLDGLLVDEDQRRSDQGFEVQMPAIEVAEKLVNIRRYIATMMDMLARRPQDRAQPLVDSLAYRLRQLPKVDEQKVMAIHIATRVPLDDLRKASMKMQVNVRQQLQNVASDINDLATQLRWKSIVSEAELETLFDDLPIQTQYRLLGNIVRSLKGAMDAEIRTLIRTGNMGTVTNRLIIEQTFNGYVAHFKRFVTRNTEKLDQYSERGYPLPTLDELLADRT